MQKVPMTRTGFDRLTGELKFLKSQERPAIIQAIAEARAHGDLKENAEYHAARDRQGFVEARIADLEDKLGRAEIIDVASLSGTTVKFGAFVQVTDEDSGEEMTWQIVGTEEGDLEAGLLSLAAPLARALIGKTIGDSVEVPAPKGIRMYEILDVRFE